MKVKLRRATVSDAPVYYTWKADPELSLLNAELSLTSSLQQYLLDYYLELQDPTKYRFAIETPNGKLIGNCTYFNINKKEAEISIMIGDRNYWDKGYGTEAITVLVNHIFSNTNLERIHLRVLVWNVRARRCYEKCGFVQYGLRSDKDGYNFILMGLRRQQWEDVCTPISNKTLSKLQK